MIDNPTERRLTIRIQPDQVILYEQQTRRKKTIYTQQYNSRNFLNLPIYIYGYVTQIVSIDYEKSQVKCKFNIYATVITNLTRAHVKDLRMKEKGEMDYGQYQKFIDQQHRMLKKFISNNLILEFNNYEVDICQEEIAYLSSSLDNQDSDSQSQEQLQNHYYRQFPTTQSGNSITYFIKGTFPCNISINDLYFPYHTLESNIILRARRQHYDNIEIKYQLIFFDQDYKDIYKQFGIILQNYQFRKFGHYGFIRTQSTQKLKALKKSQFVDDYRNYMQDYRNSMQDSQYLSQTQGMQFSFKIYSFNLRFSFTNIAPLLLLSFVSLMCYTPLPALDDTFGNVIMLLVTIIQLFIDFRKSQFSRSTFNIYQMHILAIVLIDFLLVIVCVQNFYSPEASNPNANMQSPVFWVSVAIAIVFAVANFVIFLYFPYKVQNQYTLTPCKKELKCMWNQQMIKSMVDEFQAASIFDQQKKMAILLEPN